MLDTNRHHFESIACLKLLRDGLGDAQISNRVLRLAAVQPTQYREPGVVGPNEAYFSDIDDAYTWLREQM